ncbi:MAG: hypothetical protein KDA85_00900 [Planctomycetaceae bacterium]|nr:hypothetical protein [Planctomycetaceae bacterium]
MKLLVATALFATLATTWLTSGATGIAVVDDEPSIRARNIPVETQQGRDRGQPVEAIMLAKLNAAERVLEGLVTHDMDRVRSAAETMKLMSLDPPAGWEKDGNDDDEVYEHFRMEFMRQSARLEQMAADGNMAGAAYYQQNLTATCIACHDYIRDYQQNK